jgi:hypothetical protein
MAFEKCAVCGADTEFLIGSLSGDPLCRICRVNVTQSQRPVTQSPPDIESPSRQMLDLLGWLRRLALTEDHLLSSPEDRAAVGLARRIYQKIRAVQIDKLRQRALF